MKRALLLLFTALITLTALPGPLVLIKTGSPEITKQYFSDNDLVIHHYEDNLIVATCEKPEKNFIQLDADPGVNGNFQYFLIRHNNDNSYLDNIRALSEILYQESGLLIAKVHNSRVKELYPSIHGGLINIFLDGSPVSKGINNSDLILSPAYGSRSPQDYISDMLDEVDTINLRQLVQHLQDYGTRDAYSAESVQAQNWIYDEFESYGLDVELHDFWMPSGEASDNIIATLTGTKYPDEYVVCGAHYDSYSWSGIAPGADDNATGTAGVLEAARIMGQYSFDRSIIFAAWSGEEYGLYGSQAWASEAAENGMDILGYFNMDMAGYLHPGNEIQTDIIAPSSAQELVNFYTETCAIYLPGFIVSQGYLSGGDSDHTSFNNNGYMGIFPFEDASHYSPYIHTSGDTIGTSVNSFTMHGVFTKAMIANLASMADLLPSPYLMATAGDRLVELNWDLLEDVDYYNVYRDNDAVPYMVTTNTTVIDTAVQNATPYSYYVKAVFSVNGAEGPASNQVTVAPMPELILPYFEDYETGGWYWTFDDTWGLRDGIFFSPSNSLCESPGGNYSPNMNASAILRAISLVGLDNVDLSFQTKYYIEEGYDYMYLEASTDGENWDLLDSFTGMQYTWQEKSYSLNDYAGNDEVMIRFRFYSDGYLQENGMFIDDFTISYDAVGIGESPDDQDFRLDQNFPNPFSDQTTIGFYLETAGNALLELYDAGGRSVKTLHNGFLESGYHRVILPAGSLKPGFYYYRLVFENNAQFRKSIILSH